MRKRTWMTLIGLTLVAAWQLGGCASVIPPIQLTFGLGGTLGTLEIEDGVGETQGTATFNPSEYNIASGSIQLDPTVISIQDPTLGGEEKGYVAAAVPEEVAAACTGDPLIVNVWVGPAEQVETIFDDGEEYGPFEVTLNEECVPTSVSPTSVTLSATTVELLESGNIAIGLRVESPVDGTVVIDSLSFTVRVSL